MSSIPSPHIYSYLADGAIAKGKAVAIGSDKNHVVVGSANTQACIGIAQSAASTAEDTIEVALSGGGAKALAGESLAAGDLLVSHTDGTLVKANASGDRIVAMALESAVAADLCAVQVSVSQAAAAI